MTEGRSYHGQPIIKQPVWTWEIPCYLFTGGMAGASAGLAYLSGRRGEDELARRAWATALLGVTVSPALLTSDLGKPLRFANMLRLFKVTSPMSVGSWILAASGASTAIAAANAWTGLFPRSSAFARPAASLLGLPLSTYTGALLTNTAVPIWHEARQLLPYVFASGAALSAGAALTTVTPPAQAAAARRLALGGAIAEVGFNELMKHRLGELAEPYEQDQAATYRRISQTCIATGGALLGLRGRTSRPEAILAGALLLTGGLTARWSVFKAGFKSAADPKYVVGPQRARIERGDRPGAARSTTTTTPNHALGSPATFE
jgi:polysulfide reductase-like protein